MDTKEKRPKAGPSGRRPEKAQAGKKRPAWNASVQPRRERKPEAAPPRRRPAPAAQPAPEKNTRRRRGPAKNQGRARREEVLRNRRTSARPQKDRVMRAPRENVPEVVYTMPRPFRKGAFLLKLVSVVAVVLAVVLATSIFFRVDTIKVSGMEKYTPSSIREASGISEGDALLRVSKPRTSGRIIAKLPYIDKVKVTRHLPGTVLLEVSELKVTYAIQATDSTWWLMTSGGRIVEQLDTTAASGYTRIIGFQLDGPRAGQEVRIADSQAQTQPPQEETQPEESQDGLTIPTRPIMTRSQRFDALLEILNALEENEVMGQIASIDITDPENITLEYGQRFHVILGTAERLGYKIGYMAKAVRSLDADDRGELDVSFVFKEEAILTPDA